MTAHLLKRKRQLAHPNFSARKHDKDIQECNLIEHRGVTDSVLFQLSKTFTITFCGGTSRRYREIYDLDE